MLFFANPKSEYLHLKKKIDTKVKKILNSNSYILGKEVENFEKNFSKYIGVNYSVGVSNGTDAIILALQAINIKKGDEIITTSHTAFATIAAIVDVGATPVFIDIKENDFTIDVSKIENKITKKTKAIIAVHIYGNPVDIKEILKIKKKFKITLIEDCAQAHGAEYNKKKVGTFGDFATFSFYPTKNLSTYGDGGMVSTNNNKMFKKIKLLREYGWQRKNYSTQKGSNKRLDELHAGILSIKLAHLDKFNNKRILIAKKYLKKINSKKLILPKMNSLKKHVFHLFVLRIKDNQRDHFLDYLKKKNIYAGIHYPLPNHQQITFKKYNKTKLHITEKISSEIVSIPIYPLLSTKDVNNIINAINNF
ncbi:DegT/DnrJ/EryC1/StrS family aminotransferase [bacterium]|nr:DegT/DnrJ/EryC1/StrS family aminotransferase [bacterium]MDB4812341.1 DegT/DnrJ/EryC1/StrS family aminotransferase [Candidatus Pelagibacter sp.]